MVKKVSWLLYAFLILYVLILQTCETGEEPIKQEYSGTFVVKIDDTLDVLIEKSEIDNLIISENWSESSNFKGELSLKFVGSDYEIYISDLVGVTIKHEYGFEDRKGRRLDRKIHGVAVYSKYKYKEFIEVTQEIIPMQALLQKNGFENVEAVSGTTPFDKLYEKLNDSSRTHTGRAFDAWEKEGLRVYLGVIKSASYNIAKKQEENVRYSFDVFFVDEIKRSENRVD